MFVASVARRWKRCRRKVHALASVATYEAWLDAGEKGTPFLAVMHCQAVERQIVIVS